MSLAGIRAGLYTTLTACGPWAGSEISTCDFGVMETVNSASCITLLPDGTSQIAPLDFGTLNSRGYRRVWRIGGKLWLRDTGEATRTLNRVWLGYDDLYNTISKDDSLNGSCKAAYVAAIANQFGQFFKIGGQLWKPIDFVVLAEEF